MCTIKHAREWACVRHAIPMTALFAKTKKDDIHYGSTRRGTFTSTKSSMHAKTPRAEMSNFYNPGPGQYEAPQQFYSSPLPVVLR